MADAPAPAAPVPKPSASPLLMLMLMFLMLMIMFDANLRNAIGTLAGFALMPAIGFDFANPLWTVFAAGILSITFSTIIRHFMVDWIEMARIQKRMGALRKASMDAFKARNMNRVEQLSKIQRESSAETMGMTMNQMKPTMITMIFVIGGFTWLWVFISAAPYHFFSVPWFLNVDMTASNVLPNWILVYSLLTIPIGQVIGRGLKIFTFGRRLKKLEGAKA